MSSVGSKGVIIQDTLGGDSATVTDGRLDVNALTRITDGSGDVVNVTPNGELEVHIESLDGEIYFPTRLLLSNNVTNTSVTIGTGSTEICDVSATRLSYTIVNDSDEVIYLSIEDAAVMNSGIRLNPNGGSFSDVFAVDKVFGICASGSKNVTVCQQFI